MGCRTTCKDEECDEKASRGQRHCQSPASFVYFSFREIVPRFLGGGNRFTPLVISPSGVPAVTDEEAARADPELAVLSAMAHGQNADTETAVRIAVAAMAASVGLDPDRATLHFDLVETALSEAARKALRSVDPSKQASEFARHYFLKVSTRVLRRARRGKDGAGTEAPAAACQRSVAYTWS